MHHTLGQLGNVAPAANYTPLLVPIVIVLVAAIALAIGYNWTRDRLTRWLITSRARRGTFVILFGAVAPIALGALLDWIDLSEIAQGKFDAHDGKLIVVSGLIVLCMVLHQVVNWHLDDTFDRKLKAAEAQFSSDKDAIQADAAAKIDEAAKAADHATKLANVKVDTLEETLRTIIDSSLVFGLAHLKLRKRRRPLVTKENAGQVEALANEQIAFILQSAHRWLKKEVGKDHTLRIAYFQLKDKHLVPVYSFDGTKTKCVLESDRNLHWFNTLEAPDKCLAVWARPSGQVEIVSDCPAADADDKSCFSYFQPEQRQVIQSIIVLPLNPARPDIKERLSADDSIAGREIADIVCIDTSKLGFFKESDRARWMFVQHSLTSAILPERMLIDDAHKAIESGPISPSDEAA